MSVDLTWISVQGSVVAVGDVLANVETPDAGPEADAARQEARATLGRSQTC